MTLSHSVLAWSGLGLALLAAGPSTAAGEAAAAAQAELWEVDRTTTVGQVAIAASRPSIYAVATDYENWQNALSDVTKVELLEGGREDGLVKFKSRALKRTVTVRFANTPNQMIAFTLVDGGPPGAAATGRYVLTAADDGTTLLSAELYMEVTGVSGLFVSDERVRKMRRAKLRADLEDLATYFAPAESTARD